MAGLRTMLVDEVKGSLWSFALIHGALRLGSEAVIVTWLILLLRKSELTELEFILPVLIAPAVFFVYGILVWARKHKNPKSL